MGRFLCAGLCALGLLSGCGGQSDGGGTNDGGGSGGTAGSVRGGAGGDSGSGGTGRAGAGTGGTGGTGGGEGCTYLGWDYEVGAQFRAEDGCNSCTCASARAVSCTTIECACNPDDEPWRSYVARSPAECAVIDYACSGGTPFSNSCGCGCQQDPNCPEWLNCMPGSETCDIEHCPLSQRAL